MVHIVTSTVIRDNTEIYIYIFLAPSLPIECDTGTCGALPTAHIQNGARFIRILQLTNFLAERSEMVQGVFKNFVVQ
jgi:hypothetical protein